MKHQLKNCESPFRSAMISHPAVGMYTLSRHNWGNLGEESPVSLFVLTSPSGAFLHISSFGATIVKFGYADASHAVADVVLGFDSFPSYLAPHPYIGAVVGRCANRINFAKCVIDGREINFSANSYPHHLHGGFAGWDKRNWSIKSYGCKNDSCFLELALFCKDGQEGYPGDVQASITYTLAENPEESPNEEQIFTKEGVAKQVRQGFLSVEYCATTNKPTIINPTQHSYFNLNGGKSDVLQHKLQLWANAYTLTNRDNIPIGSFIPLEDSCFKDLATQPVKLGDLLAPLQSEIEFQKGIDHNFVLAHYSAKNHSKIANFNVSAPDCLHPAKVLPAALLLCPENGRYLKVYTDSCGMQVYTLNEENLNLVGKEGVCYQKHWGVCFETQFFPDSVNHPNFPSCILYPEQVFRSKTIFEFGSC